MCQVLSKLKNPFKTQILFAEEKFMGVSNWQVIFVKVLRERERERWAILDEVV